jgi:hypothetical protein
MAATMMASAQQVFEVKKSGPSQLLLSSPGVSRAQPQRNSVDLRSLPLASRLSCIPGALAQRFEPGTLALIQVWTSCMDGRWAGVSAAKAGTTVFRTQPVGASLSDPAMAPFRAACCESGIVRSAIGMLGKVWSSGALAVVQNVAIIPTSVHPRSKLDDNMTERVAELAYIPVYDLRQPEAGVVACLEVMMSAFATSALVANVISHTCDLLTQFQLSLGKPAAHPAVVMAAPSPFASFSYQQPPPTLLRASMDCPRPLPPPHVRTRASMDSPRPLPPLERHLRTAPTAPPTAMLPCTPSSIRCPPAAHLMPGSAAGSYSSSSGSSRPDSPGTPSAQPPPLQRRLSMQRTASIRRLDSLADMCVG